MCRFWGASGWVSVKATVSLVMWSILGICGCTFILGVLSEFKIAGYGGVWLPSLLNGKRHTYSYTCHVDVLMVLYDCCVVLL